MEAGANTNSVTRMAEGFVRLVNGDRQSPLELLVGAEFRPQALRRILVLTIGGLITTFGLAILATSLAGDVAGFHLASSVSLAAVLLGFYVVIVVTSEVGPGVLAFAMVWVPPTLIVTIWLAGPGFDVSPPIITMMFCILFVLVPRRAAIIGVSETAIGLAILLAFGDGYPQPVTKFILVVGYGLTGAAVINHIAHRVYVLSTRERESRVQLEHAHVALEEANALLESRVDAQVDQIDRLGRMRRFLSSQVADTVMSGASDELLSTHRRQIAVIFIDLRGFTAFSAVAEPEDVVVVLDEFYGAVGAIVTDLDATVGGLAGDGVMAYFNDPVPCDDPAGRALQMAVALRAPMTDLRKNWRSRGYDIGYGAGIAFGYATLGTIGFEGRSDYTPIGSVVNLASRLCDEARDGEILLDTRAYNAVGGELAASSEELTLKGFPGTVPAYRLTL